ncbi:MAG: transporter [Betaproteobacteria bacterium]|nr:transporter [Betaproteobacteria bacterium]
MNADRKVMMRAITATGVACALLLTRPGYSHAQTFPNKPVRWIVAFGAGGPGDELARVIAPALSELWKQQVIIDNRPGANTIVGTELAARAAPDGYTMVMISSGFTINTTLYPKLPYDPLRDLVAVTPFAFGPAMLVVHPSVPVRDLKELIAFAKEKPDALSYASGGNGAFSHLAVELIKAMSGAAITHVPYRSMPQGLTGVIGGEAQLIVPTIPAALPHVKAGRLRGLGVTSARRSSASPETPTIAEAGLPGYEADNWYAVLVPAGTHRAIVEKLNADLRSRIELRDVKERMLRLGMDARGMGSQDFAAYVRSETVKWAKVVKASGAKAE